MPLSVDGFAKERKATGLCFDSFADVYSPQTKTPIVTVERLNRASIQDAQDEERTDRFFPDPRLKASDRASLDDYRGSGYDRGHDAPAADQSSSRGMAQCFSLADMSPQASKNNRGVWAKVETDVRKYVLRSRGDVFVYTGPLFLDKNVATIGRVEPAVHQLWNAALSHLGVAWQRSTSGGISLAGDHFSCTFSLRSLMSTEPIFGERCRSPPKAFSTSFRLSR